MTNTNNKILFYLRNTDRHPFGAVAMEYVNDVSEGGEAEIYIAASMCHTNDPWNTQVARQKTLGRLGSEGYRVKFLDTVLDQYPALSLDGVLRKLGLNQKNHLKADVEGNQQVFIRELQFLIDKNVPDGSFQ